MGGDQELHPGRPGHLLAGEHQGDRLGLCRQLLEDGQGPVRGRLDQDPVVDAEAAAKVAAERFSTAFSSSTTNRIGSPMFHLPPPWSVLRLLRPTAVSLLQLQLRGDRGDLPWPPPCRSATSRRNTCLAMPTRPRGASSYGLIEPE